MKPLIGIALGSGVARGWAHIGVLRALEEAGYRPDIIAGTSIGALVGGAYLSGHMSELEAWALRLNRIRLSRMFDFQLGGSGVISGRRVLQVLHPEMMSLSVEDLPVPFVCVATDLSSGHEVWVRTGNLVEALRASYAIPGLLPPVMIEGRWLIDGALANPVPVSVCRAIGAHVTIGVNLNGEAFNEDWYVYPANMADLNVNEAQGSDEIRNKHPASHLQIARQFFGLKKGRPSALAVMARSLHIVQDRIARSRLAGDPPDLMIFPKLGNVGVLDFHRAQESISAGEIAARAFVPRLRELVGRIRNGHAPWEKGRQKGRQN